MSLTMLKNLIKIAYSTGRVDESQDVQQVQVGAMHTTRQSAAYFPVGFSCNYPTGTFGVTFNVLGEEQNKLFFPWGPNNRVRDLEEGDAVIFSPTSQTYAKFRGDGVLEIDAKSDLQIAVNGSATITASNITLAGTTTLGTGPQQPIARLGDQVTVAGIMGTITSAGTNTSD